MDNHCSGKIGLYSEISSNWKVKVELLQREIPHCSAQTQHCARAYRSLQRETPRYSEKLRYKGSCFGFQAISTVLIHFSKTLTPKIPLPSQNLPLPNYSLPQNNQFWPRSLRICNEGCYFDCFNLISIILFEQVSISSRFSFIFEGLRLCFGWSDH